MGVTGFDGGMNRLWTSRGDVALVKLTHKTKTANVKPLTMSRCRNDSPQLLTGFGGTWQQKPHKNFMKKRRKTHCHNGHLRTPDNIGSDDHCKYMQGGVSHIPRGYACAEGEPETSEF